MTTSSEVPLRVLGFLREAEDYVSGQQMAQRLGLSRASVWKAIDELRRRGYRIEGRAKKGYRLLGVPEGLDPLLIREGMRARVVGRRVHLAEEVDSTNSWALQRALKGAEEGEVFLADAQRAGRGRVGRSWFSPPGSNLYMSVLLRPKLPPSKVPLLGLCGATAVAEALRDLGLDPEIKWPNDVLLGGKKVCGVLAEAHTEADRVLFVVLGIGINVNMDPEQFPEELREQATSVKAELGRAVDRNALARAVLEALDGLYASLGKGDYAGVLARWKAFSRVEGREVIIEALGERIEGVVQGVDEDGALWIKTPQGSRRVLSGDLRVRRW